MRAGWTYPAIAAAVKLHANSLTLDGEAIVVGTDAHADHSAAWQVLEAGSLRP
jgi:hypothetical protein